MKKLLIGCGWIILIVVGSIVLFYGVRQFVVTQGAKNIDWEVNNDEYLQALAEELTLQHETRSTINDTILYLKDSELNSEPMLFYTFDTEQWKKTTSMKHTGRSGRIIARLTADDQYYEQVNARSYQLPEVSLVAGKIVIKKDDTTHAIEVDTDEWYVTHFNEHVFIIQSYEEEAERAYFITLGDEIEHIVLTEEDLVEKGKVKEFEQLLLANPIVKNKQSRFLPFDYSKVWDKQEEQFWTIAEEDLLSQDGQSILRNYKRIRHENYQFSVLTTEQYIENKMDEQKRFKIPEASLIKKSTLPAVGLGEVDVLSFTSERMIFHSNTPSFIVGTAGIVTVSVELTGGKPRYSIVYVEENK